MKRFLEPAAREWGFMVAVGIAAGFLEGAIYRPPEYLELYWLLLGLALGWSLKVTYGWDVTVALLPAMVVVQDAVSLWAQGAPILNQGWYASVFGSMWFTSHTWGVTNWYLAATAYSLLTYYLIVIRGRIHAGRTPAETPGEKPE